MILLTQQLNSTKKLELEVEVKNMTCLTVRTHTRSFLELEINFHVFSDRLGGGSRKKKLDYRAFKEFRSGKERASVGSLRQLEKHLPGHSSAGGGARRRDKWYMYAGKCVLLTIRVVGRTQVGGEVNHRPRGQIQDKETPNSRWDRTYFRIRCPGYK